MDPSDEDSNGARSLLEAGADLAGAVLGTTVGAASGDPTTAIAGSAMGVAITHASLAVGSQLFDRARSRAGVALWAVGIDTDRRRREGQEPRADGFFDARDGQRPEAEELLEGVLRQAAESWEERKLPFLAHLWTATAHDEQVAAADARYFTRLAGGLTYRQLVALAVFMHHDEHFRALARAAGRRAEGRAIPDDVVLSELDELGRLRLLGVRANDGQIRDPAGLWGGGVVSETAFGKLHLTPAGERFATLAGLGAIDAIERERWLRHLDG